MPDNAAAWINARNARLEAGTAPYTPPAPDQIVIRNHAAAVNPLDWIIQADGRLLYRWLNYPTVLGSDVAGVVAEAGAAVTRFRPGDRVLGHAVGSDKDSNSAAEGGFQRYTAVLERMAAPIPDTMPFEDAAVLPLGISTAACGLFQANHLGLQRPSADVTPTRQTVLVWGGSTSVGSNAIQLARAAGYEVVTTASPRNVDYVTSLGAGLAFDYNSPAVVPDIIAALDGRSLAGAIAIGTTSAPSCARIAASCAGSKIVSIATPPVSFASLADPGRGRLTFPRLALRLVSSNIGLQLRARSRGVRLSYIFATTVKDNDICTAIYRDFLPGALASGTYVAEPLPAVVGHGIDDFQHAMDIQRKGVSATKVVVSLEDETSHLGDAGPYQ